MSNALTTAFGYANVTRYKLPSDTDDGPSIRRAITDAINNGLGGIYLPPGNYFIDELSVGTIADGVVLFGVDDFVIQGAGTATQLNVATTDFTPYGSYALLRIDTCNRIILRDLYIDGNRGAAIMPLTMEWSCVEVVDSADVIIENVHCAEIPSVSGTAGQVCAGYRLGNATAAGTNRITLRRSSAFDSDDTCLIVDALEDFLLVEDCAFFNAPFAIRLNAATGATSASDYIFDSVFMEVAGTAQFPTGEAVLVAFGNAAFLDGRVIIGNCVGIDGRLNVTDFDEMSVTDSIFVNNNSSSFDIISPSSIQDRIIISGNIINGSLFGIVVRGGSTPAIRGGDYVIENNVVDCHGCIVFTAGAFNIVIRQNLLRNSETFAARETLSLQQTTNSSALLECVSIFNNVIETTIARSIAPIVFDVANAAAGGDMFGFAISGNRVIGDFGTDGIVEFRPPAGPGLYLSLPLMTNNQHDEDAFITTASLAELPEPAYVVGGNFDYTTPASRGAFGNFASEFVVDGDPALAGVLTGSVSDVARRIDGAAGSVFYAKEVGNGSSGAGQWVAKI